MFEQEVQEYLDAMLVTLSIMGYEVTVTQQDNFIFYAMIYGRGKEAILELSNNEVFTAHLYIQDTLRFIKNKNIRSTEYPILDILKTVNKWLEE